MLQILVCCLRPPPDKGSIFHLSFGTSYINCSFHRCHSLTYGYNNMGVAGIWVMLSRPNGIRGDLMSVDVLKAVTRRAVDAAAFSDSVRKGIGKLPDSLILPSTRRYSTTLVVLDEGRTWLRVEYLTRLIMILVL